MFNVRENYRSERGVSCLPNLGSFLPRKYVLSRHRWAMFKCSGGDLDSSLGRLVRLLEAILAILLVVTFTVSSLPQYRERNPGNFGSSSIPATVFVWTSWLSSSFFAFLFTVRLLCVTSVPSKEELDDLVLQVQREKPDMQPILSRGDSLSLGAQNQEEEEIWGDSEEEEAKEEAKFSGENFTPYTPSYEPGKTYSSGSYDRGGLCRGSAMLIKFLSLPSTILDLLSFLPAFLDLSLGSPPELLIFRVARFVRVLRLLRSTSETLAFRLVRRSLANASSGLWSSLLPTLLVVMALFSSAIYYCEGGTWKDDGAQGPGFYRPDVTGTRTELTPFRSVLHSAWFVLVTLSTLGYGDMTPTSAVGKLVTALAIGTGIVCVVLPPPPQRGVNIAPAIALSPTSGLTSSFSHYTPTIHTPPP